MQYLALTLMLVFLLATSAPAEDDLSAESSREQVETDSDESFRTYSLARMKLRNLQVRLDDAELHMFPNDWPSPRTSEAPYVDEDDLKYPAR